MSFRAILLPARRKKVSSSRTRGDISPENPMRRTSVDTVDFVKVTEEDCVSIFARWNEQAVENGWDKNPLDPKLQAEHFMLLANEHLNRKSGG
jgi:hypothetical protein